MEKMYKKIKIENLRGIKQLEIDDLRQFNLIVGENNSGKTTILEGLWLLVGGSNPDIPLRANVFRDLSIISQYSLKPLFNKLDVNSNIKLSGEFENPKHYRQLIIKPNMESIALREKETKEAIVETEYSTSGIEPIMNGLVLDFYSGDEDKKLKKIKSSFIMAPEGIKFDRPEGYKEYLHAVYLNPKNMSGKDLVNRFDINQKAKKIDKIIEILVKMEPSVKDLSLGVEGIIYADIGLPDLIPVNALGAGFLKFLSILLAVIEKPNSILIIDEIENGLYPTSQNILWDSILSLAKESDVQIFATTHSLECIRAFNSSYSRIIKNTESDKIRLFRIEKKADDFRVMKYNYKTLEAAIDRGWEVR